MAEQRQRDRWDHTSAIVAAVFNAQRAPGARPVYPHQFNPFHAAKEQRPKFGPTISLAQLEAAWTQAGFVKKG